MKLLLPLIVLAVYALGVAQAGPLGRGRGERRENRKEETKATEEQKTLLNNLRAVLRDASADHSKKESTFQALFDKLFDEDQKYLLNLKDLFEEEFYKRSRDDAKKTEMYDQVTIFNSEGQFFLTEKEVKEKINKITSPLRPVEKRVTDRAFKRLFVEGIQKRFKSLLH